LKQHISKLPIAVLSVIGPNDAEYLALSSKYLEEKNPNSNIEYFFGFLEDCLVDLSQFNHLKMVNFFKYKSGEFSFANSESGSSKHSYILNKLLESVSHHEYIFFIDPDCFVLEENAITKIVNIMRKKELHFFGAPWGPKKLNDFWDFPAVQFLCLKGEVLKNNTLDFRPVWEKEQSRYINENCQKAELLKSDLYVIKAYLKQIIKSILKLSPRILALLLLVAQIRFYRRNPWEPNKDTGYLLREQHIQNYKSDILESLYSRHEQSSLPIGFDLNQYLYLNPDLRFSEELAVLSLKLIGRERKRSIGKQCRIYRYIFARNWSSPQDSVYNFNKIVLFKDLECTLSTYIQDHKSLKYWDYFFWEKELFCLHIGGKNKKGAGVDSIAISEINRLITAAKK
jgi:hypothetical protein